MGLVFEWDTAKARENDQKHGVTFREARTAFGDEHSITVDDPSHSLEDARFLLLGMSQLGRLLVVSLTERNDRIRIISARLATRRERHKYEEGI
jgi:uncharacterized DUF497 family protein